VGSGNQNVYQSYSQARGTWNTGHFLYANETRIVDHSSVNQKNVTGAVNNGSGLIRLTVTAHGYTTGDRIAADSVGGVPNAQGSWIVTVIDANTIDLQGSTFAGTYTSGGITTNRAGYAAYLALVAPSVSRGGNLTGVNLHADDVCGFFVSNNGTAKATDPYYVGHNSTIAASSPEWDTAGSYDARSYMGILINNADNTPFRGTSYGTSVNPEIALRRARGSFDAPRRAKSADLLGMLTFTGGNAADDSTASVFGSAVARIDAYANEDFTASAQGSRLVFYTTPIGSNAPTEKFRVANADGIDFNSGTFTNYMIRLKNAAWIQGMNQAGSAGVNMFRLNTSNVIELGAQLSVGAANTIFIAASNAPTNVKNRADYICDGTADDVEIQAAVSALTLGGAIQLSEGLFNISTTVTVAVDGVVIKGTSRTDIHFGGSRTSRGTEIQWTGADAGGPVFAIEAASGAGAAIKSSWLENMAIYCSTQGVTPAANIGIRLRSLWRAHFVNVAVKEAKVACWQCTAYSTGFTGGDATIHSCSFANCSGYSYAFNGIPLQCRALASVGGTTLCTWFGGFFYSKDATASIDLSACDDLFFYGTAIGKGAGVAHSLELRGKDTANGYWTSARNIHFYSFFGGSASGAGIYARAGDGTDPSHANYIHGLSFEDGDIPVTVETGAQLYVEDTRGRQRYLGAYTYPALDFYGGTFSTGVMRLPNDVYVRARNAADNTDLNVWKFNSLNEFQVDQPARFQAAVAVAASTTWTFGSSVQFALSTSANGFKLGTASTQLLALWGKTPIVQPTGRVTLSNYTAAARSFNRSSYTMDQLADLVCEIFTSIIQPVGLHA
jgi:hypothetical protein